MANNNHKIKEWEDEFAKIEQGNPELYKHLMKIFKRSRGTAEEYEKITGRKYDSKRIKANHVK